MIESTPLLGDAVANNARWCDTVCRAHGVGGEFHESFWVSRHPVPRFYPNLVTLRDARAADTQRAEIQSLIEQEISPSWSVKDSFRCLELGDLGFEPLFEASWIGRMPETAFPPEEESPLRWSLADSVRELEEWEAAWGAKEAAANAAPLPHLFVPVLLADPDVAFVAGYAGSNLVAGGIANRTGGVVGLSNVFARSREYGPWWPGCVRSVRKRFPGLPIVGYEQGADLAAARAAGFEAIPRASPARARRWPGGCARARPRRGGSPRARGPPG